MQPISNNTNPIGLDHRTIGGIAFGLILAIIMMPFIIIFALINEAIGSSEVTTSPGDNLNKDDRDEFGYKPGDVFYSKPGTGPNPFLADMWEKSDETWYK